MSDWNIEQLREAVDGNGRFIMDRVAIEIVREYVKGLNLQIETLTDVSKAAFDARDLEKQKVADLRLQNQELEKARQLLWAKVALLLDWHGTTRIPKHAVELFEASKCEVKEWQEGEDYCFAVRQQRVPTDKPKEETPEHECWVEGSVCKNADGSVSCTCWCHKTDEGRIKREGQGGAK